MVFLEAFAVAVRSLRRRPAGALVAAGTLAVGIGLATAVFSVVDGILLRDLPLPTADRLLAIGPTAGPGGPRLQPMPPMPLGDFQALRESTGAFDGLAAHQASFVFLRTADGTDGVVGSSVSPDFFPLLGVQPALGRLIAAADCRSEAPPVAVLGHALWRVRFAADPAVIGRTVRINRELVTVIGVAPPGFAFPYRQQLWLAMRLDPAAATFGAGRPVFVFGRRSRGATPGRLRGELERAAAVVAAARPTAAAPSPASGPTGFTAEPYATALVEQPVHTTLHLLLVAVAALMLVACANVANLLLVRTAARRGELAVRAALGASPRRLIAPVLAESLLVALAGALLAAPLAAVGVRLYHRLAAVGDPLRAYWIDVRLDGATFAFALAVAAGAALIAGGLPALLALRTDVRSALATSNRGAGGGRARQLQRAAVVVQVTAAVALLVVAGGLVGAVRRIAPAAAGFAAEGVFTARISLWAGDYPSAEARRRAWREIVGRLAELPEIAAVALSSALPGDASAGARVAAGIGSAGSLVEAYPLSVGRGFFGLFGVEFEQGRPVELSEGSDPPAVVLSHRLADRLFAGAPAVGRRVRLEPEEGGEGEREAVVVGVVADAAVAADAPGAVATLYRSLETDAPVAAYLAVRARSGAVAETAEPAIRRAVAAYDPAVAIYDPGTLEERLARRDWAQRTLATLVTVFAGAALMLAAIGLYGAMAFAVRSRTRELGVRQALGAGRGDLRRLILGEGIVLLACGWAGGVVVAMLAGRWLAGWLVGVSTWEGRAVAGATALLLIVGLAACALPAARAARLEAVEALRTDG